MEELPTLVLGTALWGWTIPEATAKSILDLFYKEGFRQIDTATNYPINGDPKDFRKAEKVIQEWITSNHVIDLQINVKIGSLANNGSSENNLVPSFILMNGDHYEWAFGSNLFSLMVHWDNRSNENEIQQSIESLRVLHKSGLYIGLSGISHPKIYKDLAPDLKSEWTIQIKHGLPNHQAYSHYKDFHGCKCFSAYGISGGGLGSAKRGLPNSSTNARSILSKFQVDAFMECLAIQSLKVTHEEIFPSNFYLASLLFACHSPDIKSVIIAPSTLEQLSQIISYYRKLSTHSGMNLYREIFNQMEQFKE